MSTHRSLKVRAVVNVLTCLDVHTIGSSPTAQSPYAPPLFLSASPSIPRYTSHRLPDQLGLSALGYPFSPARSPSSSRPPRSPAPHSPAAVLLTLPPSAAPPRCFPPASLPAVPPDNLDPAAGTPLPSSAPPTSQSLRPPIVPCRCLPPPLLPLPVPANGALPGWLAHSTRDSSTPCSPL